MNKEELLEVLDMSKDKQWEWICKNHFVWSEWDHNWYYGKQIICCIADLAFRLRDEAVKANHRAFHDGIYEVMLHVVGNDNLATAFWGEEYAKPIHWIIAALIAKGD